MTKSELIQYDSKTEDIRLNIIVTFTGYNLWRHICNKI